jgi:hypothetical protein
LRPQSSEDREPLRNGRLNLQGALKIRPAMPVFCILLAGLAFLSLSGVALSKDRDDGDDPSAKADSTLPNIYLDLRTNYATVPANALSIGFGNSSLSTAIATLQTLSTLTNSQVLPTLPRLSSPSSRSVAVDVPLTVDVSDSVSLYGGFSASASQGGTSDWSTFAVSSWNVGFQADVYQQADRSRPSRCNRRSRDRCRIPRSPRRRSTILSSSVMR